MGLIRGIQAEAWAARAGVRYHLLSGRERIGGGDRRGRIRAGAVAELVHVPAVLAEVAAGVRCPALGDPDGLVGARSRRPVVIVDNVRHASVPDLSPREPEVPDHVVAYVADELRPGSGRTARAGDLRMPVIAVDVQVVMRRNVVSAQAEQGLEVMR